MNTKNNFCHLNLNEKVESCIRCKKKYRCPLPTSLSFVSKYGCNFKEYLKSQNKFPVYYVDENGNEYWKGELIKKIPLTKEEQEEIDELFKEFYE